MNLKHEKENNAKNTGDVREFLYYFESSAILQYAILSLYKKLMQSEKDLILREVDEYESKAGK